jgi:hypothetical protein
MTKDEALRLALEALEDACGNRCNAEYNPCFQRDAITAIKAALEANEFNPDWDTQAVLVEEIQRMAKRIEELEAKDEPVKLRRGDILRCIETDELCTVWATSTSAKTLVKWGGNDFTNYTAEQIGELFWIEPKAKDEPVAFKIYKPTPPRHAIPNVRDAELPWVYDQDPSSGNVASMWVTPVKATPPQRTWVGLTDVEVDQAFTELTLRKIYQAIEAKLKEKNT